MSSIYDYMTNILVYDKNYKRIGTLSNGGANPQAPYYDDLYVQELDTGADTYQFSTISNKHTQDLLEIGNHVGFIYKNRFEVFTITSLEYSHYEGYKTIGVYAEGIGFELLDVFMERPPIKSYPSNDNNNSSGGNDSDGDGDDNTDNEYADPDDVYLDENGIIIYDKNGSGPPKKEDVYIDENGIITYKSNKKNEKNDSLEFKNISYPTFLNILLKNTGWSFVCQPGLESIKHNISVRYDTNIYAILQDSMQAYRGVELEFCYEGSPQNGGDSAALRKVVKAYKDGGRGSFVGKRFEYGTNVRGITKTQEVTDSEDDTVIRVDNVGVDVYYDIDFALKSAEIPEIEIGDTHYVIDRQFCPPMTIKARIGKIEISFSDPTKNKITVANNKKIRGAAVDDEDINSAVKNLDDTINNSIDDYNDIYGDDDGIISGDYIKNHDPMAYLGNLQIDEWLEVGSATAPSGFGTGIRLTNNMGETTLLPDRITAKNIEVEEDIQSRLIHVDENLDAVRIRVYGDDPITGGLHIFGQGGLHVNNFIQFADGSRLTSANGLSGGGSNPDGGGISDALDNLHVNNELTVGSDSDEYKTVITGDRIWANNISGGAMQLNDWIQVPELRAEELLEAKQVSTEKLIVEREDGESAKADIYGELYVTEKIKCLTTETNTIKFSDGTTMTTAGSSSGGGGLGLPDGVIEYSYNDELNKHMLTIAADVQVNNLDVGNVLSISKLFTDTVDATGVYTDIVDTTEIRFADGTTMTTAGGGSGNGEFGAVYADYGEIEEFCTAVIRTYPDSPMGDNYVEFRSDIRMFDYEITAKEYNKPSDKSMKENIRYIDDLVKKIDDNLLDKTDLHDFIVNQVNLCEYNFIGDTSNKIGFIANDYEGTKVGDKIVSRNGENNTLTYSPDNLLFATIGALQEEVRMRDEQIASLEARLAAIEEMLNNK